MSIEISSKYVPNDVMNHVLSFLNAKDLGQCCLVNKAWHKAASNDPLWKQFFKGENLPSGMNAKKYFEKHGVNSKNLVQRIQDFANKVSLNQKGSFTCSFPLNPGYILNMEFGYGSVTYQQNPDLEEFCFFTKKLCNDESLDRYDSSRTTLESLGFFRRKFKKILGSNECFISSRIIHGSSELTALNLRVSFENIVADRLEELKTLGQIHRNYIYSAAMATTGIAIFSISKYFQSK